MAQIFVSHSTNDKDGYKDCKREIKAEIRLDGVKEDG
jgi:hypothetical protein